MSEPRVLVLDLDGTTLDASGRLTPRDVAAARALTARGVHVTIATGRLASGAGWVARELGVKGSIAVMNGSEMIDAETGAVVRGRYVDRDARVHLRDRLRDGGLSTFLFGAQRIHYDERDARHVPYLHMWTDVLNPHTDVFAADAWETEDRVVAVCASGAHEAVAAVHEGLELPSRLRAVTFETFGGEGFLEVRHDGDDKGTAIARLAEERGCTVAECVAVGDWLNDLPMLRVAGRSFAMGHAADEVKQAAHEVLDATRRTAGAVAEVARRVWGVEV